MVAGRYPGLALFDVLRKVQLPPFGRQVLHLAICPRSLTLACSAVCAAVSEFGAFHHQVIHLSRPATQSVYSEVSVLR